MNREPSRSRGWPDPSRRNHRPITESATWQKIRHRVWGVKERGTRALSLSAKVRVMCGEEKEGEGGKYI